MSQFEKSIQLRSTPEEVFDWHSRPGALVRLTPPWQRLRVVGGAEGIEVGSRVDLRLGSGWTAIAWTAEHTWVHPGKGFEDIQIRGPFRKWVHRHLFDPDGQGGTLLRDSIDYKLPAGFLGSALGDRSVRRSLARVFDYRHRTTAADLEFHRLYSVGRPLRVGISGSSGPVGTALRAMLSGGGHEVIRLVRAESSMSSHGEVVWSPKEGVREPGLLEGLDAVIHLAGDNISRGRWTRKKKARIRDSRVLGTQNLVRSLGELTNPPKIFVSASAIGYYGDGADDLLDEASPAGKGFLAGVCEEWEAAAADAEKWAERVAMARLGVVLSPQDGALAKMLPVFRMGGGGRLGSGRQFMSWLSLDDVAGALIHVLKSPRIVGPVNLVSPEPIRNQEFTRQLGRVLRRPVVVPLPSPVAHLLFGQMADEILLSGRRVRPSKLESTGYRFRHPELNAALSFMLGRG